MIDRFEEADIDAITVKTIRNQTAQRRYFVPML